MKDPERIDRILDKLRIIWKAEPDQRLGQLLVNLRPTTAGIFYWEDCSEGYSNISHHVTTLEKVLDVRLAELESKRQVKRIEIEQKILEEAREIARDLPTDDSLHQLFKELDET